VAQSTSQEPGITLNLLRAVEGDSSLTQRSAAQELGIALGLVNTYFKRCIKKGLIKARQVPANRYAYYLTPQGLAEKSRLMADFLAQSLSLFRQAQDGYRALLEICVKRDQSRIILLGAGDLAEILLLCARDYPLTILGVVDSEARATTSVYHGAKVYADLASAPVADAFIVTSLRSPQETYDDAIQRHPNSSVYAPDLLGIKNATHRSSRGPQ